MTDKISVVIADDHTVFRQTLRRILEEESEIELLAAANGGSEALDLIRRLKPAVAVLDISMPPPDGLTVARTLCDEKSPAAIVFLTMHREQSIYDTASALGLGYVLKESLVSDLIYAIKAARRGERYASPQMSEFESKVSRPIESQPTQTNGDDKGSDLTAVERRIITQIAQYKTSREIAGELGISISLVENYRTSICEKLGLAGNHALMKFALTMNGSKGHDPQ